MKKKIIPYLCMVALIAGMLGASQIFDEKEIIFPEMAAIGLGIFISPKRSWVTNKKRMLFLISVAAVVGILIVHFVPGETWIRMILAYAVSQVILIYSRTTFAPFVSAIVLPVMLGTDSIVYVLSAVILTAAVMLVTQILEYCGIWDKGPYRKREVPDLSDWGNAGVRVAIVGVLIWIFFRAGMIYAAAPPLLVAFTEFVRPGGQPIGKPIKVIWLITFCALTGCCCRWIFDVRLGVSLTLAGVVAIVIVILLVRAFGLYIPPAGALAILPMLIPAQKLADYPFQVLLGILIYALLSRFMMKKGLLFKRIKPLNDPA